MKLQNETSPWSARLAKPACRRRLPPTRLRTRRTAARSDFTVGRGRSCDSPKVALRAVTLSKALPEADVFHIWGRCLTQVLSSDEASLVLERGAGFFFAQLFGQVVQQHRAHQAAERR